MKVELIKDPVDVGCTRMTAKVINEAAAYALCAVEAEDRPSLVRFTTELLGGRYRHGMLVDGNDYRGIDVGLFCTDAVDVVWVRSHVDNRHDACSSCSLRPCGPTVDTRHARTRTRALGAHARAG